MRTASCRCGKLQARCAGEPIRVSVCHCLECQRRTGSAFAAQVRFPAADVAITGEAREYVQIADSGSTVAFRFCPTCSATIAYDIDTWPGVVAIPYGAFADADLPAPAYSVYEVRKRPWVSITGENVEHHD